MNYEDLADWLSDAVDSKTLNEAVQVADSEYKSATNVRNDAEQAYLDCLSSVNE